MGLRGESGMIEFRDVGAEEDMRELEMYTYQRQVVRGGEGKRKKGWHRRLSLGLKVDIRD